MSVLGWVTLVTLVVLFSVGVAGVATLVLTLLSRWEKGGRR
jgi:hypothetical protein